MHKDSTTKRKLRHTAVDVLKEIENLHKRAMECAEQAFVAQANGKEQDAKVQFEEAYRLESAAANEIADYDDEPTRSVLYRSAATLALDSGHPSQAAMLARRGLEGQPPDDIEQELRDVLADALAKAPDVQDILVEYDEENNGVKVTPDAVKKGTTVRFRDPKGGALRIAFLSPMGKETESVSDAQSYIPTMDGTYHFKCYFTLPGAEHPISAETGAVIDVLPH